MRNAPALCGGSWGPPRASGRREAGRDPQTAWQSANLQRTTAAELLALVGPSAISALQAFKNMNHNSAFRFHDRETCKQAEGRVAIVPTDVHAGPRRGEWQCCPLGFPLARDFSDF